MCPGRFPFWAVGAGVYGARVGTTRMTSIGVAAAVAAVLGLFAPWARSGSTDRSSVDLLRSAGVLDVISGWQRPMAVVAWYLVILLTAAALVALAWGRVRASAVALLPLGPALTGALVIVARSPLPLRWGAVVTTGLGLTATVAASLVLIQGANWWKDMAQ